MIWTPERQALALVSVEKWRGTPHRDRMAVAGVGIDCIHFVAAVLTESGVIPMFRFPGYNPSEGLHERSERIASGFARCLHAAEADKTAPMFGDLAVFKTGRASGHCGFVLGDTLAHALAHQSVIVSNYRIWRPAVHRIFRIEATGFRVTPSDLWRDLQDSSAVRS